ncbi:MAG TPA: hypothetical protein VJK50_02215 [Patescibacteria group bacterium]|nr:hypothetical protein [Patescibacteria group bacterium]
MKPIFLSSLLLRGWQSLVFILTLGVSMSACSSMTWKEEVLLHDGQKIIVKRSQSYGGRHEIGQTPPIKEQEITFTGPNTNKTVTFKSEYGEDIGRASFNLLALHVLNGTPYLIVEPNLCLSYNKWGRPNPPYVFFKHDGKAWQRIPLSEFPVEFKNINLIVSTLSDVKKLPSHGLVSAEMVRELNSSLKQPEYKTILREPLAKERINAMCEERVLYKGHWILPDDPIARKFIDRQER